MDIASDPPLVAPRLAFIGFCERAEVVTEGHVFFWKTDMLGVSNSRAFFVFPINLRGLKVALAIYDPTIGDSFKLVFRGTESQQPFEFILQLGSAVRTDARPGAATTESRISTGLVSRGWMFMSNALEADVFVNSPGTYEIYLKDADREQLLGVVQLAHIPVAPYTPEQITALKSDPLATKYVRMVVECNSCHDKFKAYAGVEKSPSLESQGYVWNLAIAQDEFACTCGKGRTSLVPIKTGLHGLLQRNLNPETQSNISTVKLYEKTVLEQHCRDLLNLINGDRPEEELQLFLESHPIFFHVFLPKSIKFKPPILTKYFADFSVLNSRNELLLIEIERPQMKLLKKDGGKTAELEHSFHQVRTWKQVLDEHRAAALDAIGLRLDEVAKVRGVVIAGRKPSDEQKLKMLRSLSTADIELFTYDDLLNSVSELVKHIASI
jgi:hypothetical protein